MSFGYKVAKDAVYYSARLHLKVIYLLLVKGGNFSFTPTSGFKKATGKFINNPMIQGAAKRKRKRRGVL